MMTRELLASLTKQLLCLVYLVVELSMVMEKSSAYTNTELLTTVSLRKIALVVDLSSLLNNSNGSKISLTNMVSRAGIKVIMANVITLHPKVKCLEIRQLSSEKICTPLMRAVSLLWSRELITDVWLSSTWMKQAIQSKKMILS